MELEDFSFEMLLDESMMVDIGQPSVDRHRVVSEGIDMTKTYRESSNSSSISFQMVYSSVEPISPVDESLGNFDLLFETSKHLFRGIEASGQSSRIIELDQWESSHFLSTTDELPLPTVVASVSIDTRFAAPKSVPIQTLDSKRKQIDVRQEEASYESLPIMGCQEPPSKKPKLETEFPCGIPSELCSSFTIKSSTYQKLSHEPSQSLRLKRNKKPCLRCQQYRLKVSSDSIFLRNSNTDLIVRRRTTMWTMPENVECQ
jgi:hypothetical protein